MYDGGYLDADCVRVYYCVGSSSSYYVTTIWELFKMAAAEKNYELTVMDRNWIGRALRLQRQSLNRAIASESSEEVVAIRRKEMSQIDDLLMRMAL